MTAISTEGTIDIVIGKDFPNRNEMKVVPVDIQWETMGPATLNIKERITEKTVAIILTYSYGIIYNIKEISKLCRERGIDIIEDSSESFTGVSTPGSPYAEFTLLSFGMLRHHTSFGGAISVVRNNPEIYKRMLEIENEYKIERSIFYLTRVLKALRLMMVLNSDENFVLKMTRTIQQYKILHYVRKPIWKLRQRISLP
mmetsp:Transcript_24090/g.26762  ORF Transcript_24090/g.26762 Transcript_24090/m.26762 type:complete len:199 (-) Transcript_24090:458-1054(-)